jgi:N-acetyl-alpha-D-glucosaminyl L-malate synthase BshA
MNIGIVCYPTYGGSGVLATELGKALSKKGHKVHFISYNMPVRLDVMNENISYHEVSVMNYPLFEHAPYESALISKIVDVASYEGLDVLHVHYAIPHAYAGYVARQILLEQGIKLPVITTLHGTDITLVGKDSSYKPTVAFSINQSDAVTCVSNFLKQETIDYFNIQRPIDVIFNFVDHNRFIRKDYPILKTNLAPNGEKIIVHTSNFRKVKRIQDVLEMFAILYKQIDSKLVLIGDGPERTILENWCREHEMCNHVKFLGKVEAVEKVLAVADLFVLPSERESFGLAALEAMACRVPVVSSDAEGIPEVNIHGETGYLAKVGDYTSMAKYAFEILSNPELHQRMSENSYNHSLNFSLEKIMREYEDLYERVNK